MLARIGKLLPCLSHLLELLAMSGLCGWRHVTASPRPHFIPHKLVRCGPVNRVAFGKNQNKKGPPSGMMAAPNDVASLGTGEGDTGGSGSIRDPEFRSQT
jgi:hypothetical protein